MVDNKYYRKYADDLQEILRLRTFPFGVKLLEKESDIPKGTFRPLRDIGHSLSLCQAFSRSRLIEKQIYGAPSDKEVIGSPSIAMLKQDMWCPEPILAYGLAETPQYFLDGNLRYPGTHRTRESAQAWAHAFPRLDTGKYIGVISASLKALNFIPDVILIYCDSAQLSLLVQAATWKDDGLEMTCKLHPSAVCVRAVVPVIQTGQYQVNLPCWGDRSRAGAHDSELVFSLPRTKMDDLMEGLQSFAKTGRTMPVQFSYWPEHEMPDTYAKLRELMGPYE